jgi:hypothetical protein
MENHRVPARTKSFILNLNAPATYLVDNVDVPALRNAIAHLAKLGYNETQVCQRLGLTDLSELIWRAQPIFRAEKLAVRDPLALVIDLFLLQGIIPSDELDQLFDKGQQELLVRSGLLSVDENGFAGARAALYPVGEVLIFSDHAWPMLPHPGYVKVPTDQVMFIGTDSRWLARATVRQPVAAALDLCTGSGVHAILAARHAKRVVAVDISDRAARCTDFNRHASGAVHVEVKVGDLYEPVRDERFNLITANPPFVPSPVDWLRYRDGGRSGEEVQRRIIAGLPRHLAPGGIAQIVTEFGERDGQPLSDRLREWLGGAPLDLYILRLREHSATSYAIGHAGTDRGNDSFEVFLHSVRDWAENLRTQGYQRIISVLLAFQWSDPALGLPWTLSEESQPPLKYGGHEIEAVFQAERLVRRADFHDLLLRSSVRRAGLIGLLEARMLGSEIPANTQAKLAGKIFSILHGLTPAEREILLLLEKPRVYSELATLIPVLDGKPDTVFTAVLSLVRRRLVMLISSADGGRVVA